MMQVSAANLLQTGAAIETKDRARPVCFDGLAGMYHAAQGDTAVLLVSPWGFEELCSRMTYRLVGERLASLGYPCLRFDLPGTGHSTMASADIVDEQAWRKAVCTAYDQLRSLANARKVVVVGQGLGGLLAAHLAQERQVDGLILLAPASQGRGHLREVAAWTAMTKAEFRVSSTDGPVGGFMSAGFVLSAATANEIRQLKPLGSLPAVVRQVLFAARPDNAGDARLVDEFSANGLDVERFMFTDHADYVSSPIFGSVPSDSLDKVVEWLGRQFPVVAGSPQAQPTGPKVARLEDDGYVEELVRFGPSEMFFGAYTTPIHGDAGKTAVVILNAGADHSVGWGRYSVDLARALGRQGFATMRIDHAGIGETPLWPGQKQPVMYSLRANDDVACAIDWLVAEAGMERIVLLGRCSGGYPAFLSAVSDRRVVASVLINMRKLHWEPDEDFLKVVPRVTLTREQQIKRLVSGQIPLSTILRKLSGTLFSKADRTLAPVLGNRSRHYRFGRIVRERLQALTARNVPLVLLYSAGDPGLDDLADWAGDGLPKLAAHPNVEVQIIEEDADHNLSPMAARAEVTQRVLQFLRRPPA
ncbi:MAG: alpha/beta fold hydrolase [Rhizobium sp.]|nr:alpha/beta fold hydrolase [Rhizobium sp.]